MFVPMFTRLENAKNNLLSDSPTLQSFAVVVEIAVQQMPIELQQAIAAMLTDIETKLGQTPLKNTNPMVISLLNGDKIEF